MDKQRTEEVQNEGWENGCRSDRVDAIGWAGIFIWAALVLLAGSTGYADRFAWWDGWSAFLAGAGAIILIGTGARMVLPDVKRPVAITAIFGVFLLGLGLEGLISGNWFWPVLLGAVGATILVRTIARRD